MINQGNNRTRSYELQAGCSGAAIVCKQLPLRELNSPCIAITEFCNHTGDQIRVAVEGGTAIIVNPGCTVEFNGASQNLSITPLRIPFVPGGACAAERMHELPGPLNVSVSIECNRELEECDL